MQLQIYTSNTQISTQPSSHWYGQKASPFDPLQYLLIALTPDVRRESCNYLNQVLVNSTVLYDFYKSPSWLMCGNTFHQLHLLMARHAKEQLKLIDLLEEQIHLLGGEAIDNSYYLAEAHQIDYPINGVKINDIKDAPSLLSSLLEAHEIVIRIIRQAITVTEANGDIETNDLLRSKILHTYELQAWFLEECWIDEPLVSLSL